MVENRPLIFLERKSVQNNINAIEKNNHTTTKEFVEGHSILVSLDCIGIFNIEER